MTTSTLSGNSAGDGGGIYCFGATTTATITDSTIANNTATPSSGTTGFGGGIYNRSGGLTIINCTLSGNRSNATASPPPPTYIGGGGIYNDHSTLTVANCTVTLNVATRGGGILNYQSTLNLSNTIVANNTGTSGSPDLHEVGSTTSTFNLIGQDPKLGPLANNGGPTLTHALLVGSRPLTRATRILTRRTLL